MPARPEFTESACETAMSRHRISARDAAAVFARLLRESPDWGEALLAAWRSAVYPVLVLGSGMYGWSLDTVVGAGRLAFELIADGVGGRVRMSDTRVAWFADWVRFFGTLPEAVKLRLLSGELYGG